MWFWYFSWWEKFGLFPSWPLTVGQKKPLRYGTGGAKVVGQLEPSRRSGGGDDGYNNGGQAKRGFKQCCSVTVHLCLGENLFARKLSSLIFQACWAEAKGEPICMKANTGAGR